MTDLVTNPAHYNQGDIECIDAIRAALTPEEFHGYCKGNSMKYLWRERYKGGETDIRKANWYLQASLNYLDNLAPEQGSAPEPAPPLKPETEALFERQDSQEVE